MLTKISSKFKESTVIYEKFNKIFLIGLNRPEKHNALNDELIENLSEALCSFNKSDASVAVLYGNGGNFSSGYDISNINDKDDFENIKKLSYIMKKRKGQNCEDRQNLNNNLNSCLEMRFNTTKPLIAAITGYAVAAGLELALLADMRICDKGSVMGLFNRRFGLPSIDGIAQRILPRIINYSRAQDLLITGRGIKGKEAMEWGLVNMITVDGTAIGKAMNVAASIAKFPQDALLLDREVAYNYTFHHGDNLDDLLSNATINSEIFKTNLDTPLL
ncbi:unnamed protein product [Gordionus sp. m RMFG-2023]